MEPKVTDSLERELTEVEKQIQILERYRAALRSTLQVRLELQGLPGTPYISHPVTLTALTGGAEVPDARPNTIDMARTVLYNLNGEEKTPDEIRALIHKTYGVTAAKSLDQMLYKRAAQGKTFYKTESGKFGLLSLRPSIEQVRMPATGIA
jgi:hypothetical protein